MVEFQNVSFSYGEKQVLKDISFKAEIGKVLFLSGESGSGKTTLLRLIMGLEKTQSGKIINTEKRISAVFQEDRLLENKTATENITFVSKDKERAKALLGELGLKGEENTKVSSFSGGMKRRVALARALSVPFDLLLLDEPFNGLDSENKEKAVSLIKKTSENKTVIIASHSEDDAKKLGDGYITLKI